MRGERLLDPGADRVAETQIAGPAVEELGGPERPVEGQVVVGPDLSEGEAAGGVDEGPVDGEAEPAADRCEIVQPLPGMGDAGGVEAAALGREAALPAIVAPQAGDLVVRGGAGRDARGRSAASAVCDSRLQRRPDPMVRRTNTPQLRATEA
ncbi:hypothetical protein [Methylobacterium longum]|uniref:hypothetical protein n=1 Tax=Methylobacterium longum TaxID=767694 RepID=UPI0027E5080C|nr:hypothetical protein [Methylobacterium longum]